MVAAKAPTGSTPLAWVKVAVVRLLSGFDLVRKEPDTTIAGSEKTVVALRLLLVVVESGVLRLAAARWLVLSNETAGAVTHAGTVAGGARGVKVTGSTPLAVLN